MKIQGILAIVTSALFAISVRADEGDKALESSLRNSVKHELNQKDVHVDVDKGVVKLEGKVRTEADRRNIDDLVRSTPGVVAVKNKIEVKLASPANPTYPPSIPSGAPATTTTRVTVIPIYTTPPPKVVAPAPVVTLPPPVIVPD